MTGQLADPVFWRIADIPFDAYLAALESWQLTGHDGELCLGDSLLRGPIERDQHFGTWQIEVRLGRGRLRPPVRMRLEIAPWHAGATALELIPCQQVRPGAAYFAAGHRLLDSLTRALPVRVPVQQRPDEDYLHATVSAGVPALSRPQPAVRRSALASQGAGTSPSAEGGNLPIGGLPNSPGPVRSDVNHRGWGQARPTD